MQTAPFLRTRLLPLLLALGLWGLFVPGRAATAAELRSGQRVHIPAEASVDEDLYVTARELVIEGTVRGDVVAVASLVTVRGRIEGSLMAAGGTLVIEGKIGRALRTAGGQLRVSGEVGTDALAACGTCAFTAASKVGADVLTAGGELDLAGSSRRLRAAGDHVRLAGATTQDATVRAQALRIDASAATPSLLYGARGPADVSTGAHIGRLERRLDWTPAPPRRGGSLAAALMALVFGAVLLWLLPGQAPLAARVLGQRPGASLLFGLGVVITAPIVMLLLLITVVGVPLAGLAAVLCGLGLYVGYLLSAYLLGQLLLQKLHRRVRPVAALALGLLLLLIVSMLPVLGAIAGAVATLAGFGSLLLMGVDSAWFRARFRREPAPAASTPAPTGTPAG
ncbi:MAG: polymer-forming cytoskeletal protein [Polyangia bacterium]